MNTLAAIKMTKSATNTPALIPTSLPSLDPDEAVGGDPDSVAIAVRVAV